LNEQESPPLSSPFVPEWASSETEAGPQQSGTQPEESRSERSGLLLPFWWDMQKLHSLHLPVRKLSIEQLRWHLSWRVWSNYGAPFKVTPSEVRRDPVKFSVHYERAMAADLRFPLFVIRWDDKWTILDGIHRLLKADILAMTELPVCVVTPELLPEIMVPPPQGAMELIRAFLDGNPSGEESS